MAEVKPAPVETETPAAPVATTSETAPAPVEPVAETKPETSEIAPVEAKTETTEAPVAEGGEVTTEPTEPPKELDPIYEGILKTKVSFIPIYFEKYTFFLQEDGFPVEQLAEIKREKTKTKAAQANYAHATQTGKGLLFFSKGDKAKPIGIIKIEGAEITPQGEKKFTIKLGDHETHLEAGSATLRQRWVATLKTASADATGVSAAIAETPAYQEVLDKFKSPIAAAVLAVKKEQVDDKKEDKDEDKKEEDKGDDKKEEEKEEKKEKKEKKKKEKKDDDDSSSSSDEEKEEKKEKKEKKEEKKEKRSVSKTRNRFSFFGNKKEKEEKKEEKKEEEPAAVAAPVAETETPATTTEPAPVVAATTETAPATTEPAPETAKEVTEDAKPETSPVSSPKASNRKSFLGKLPSFLKKDEKKAETPAPTAEEAPKSPDPVPEVAGTTEVQPLTSTKDADPQSTEPPVGAKSVEEPKTETPAESSKSPIAGLVDNIKEALHHKKEEKAETSEKDAPAAEATEPTKETKETKETDAPVESRDRKSSLFGSFGRREKSSDGTNDEKPKRSLSFWKKEKKPVSEKDAQPAITESEPAPATTEPVKTEVDNEKTEPATKEAAPAPVPDTTATTAESEVVGGRIGDVVPAAVTVGDSKA